MGNKFVAWLNSDQFFTCDMTAFKVGAKKVLPWLIGGAAAVGGVMLGYKMMSKEPLLEIQEENTEDDIIVNPVLVEDER